MAEARLQICATQQVNGCDAMRSILTLPEWSVVNKMGTVECFVRLTRPRGFNFVSKTFSHCPLPGSLQPSDMPCDLARGRPIQVVQLHPFIPAPQSPPQVQITWVAAAASLCVEPKTIQFESIEWEILLELS